MRQCSDGFPAAFVPLELVLFHDTIFEGSSNRPAGYSTPRVKLPGCLTLKVKLPSAATAALAAGSVEARTSASSAEGTDRPAALSYSVTGLPAGVVTVPFMVVVYA